MKGMMLLLGKAKHGAGRKPAPASEPASDDDEPAERSYAREAFSALQDDDEEGFIEAFISAVRACKAKSASSAYADDEDEGDEDV
jgi:hypothetical protein